MYQQIRYEIFQLKSFEERIYQSYCEQFGQKRSHLEFYRIKYATIINENKTFFIGNLESFQFIRKI